MPLIIFLYVFLVDSTCFGHYSSLT